MLSDIAEYDKLGGISAPWLFPDRPLGGRAEFLEQQGPTPVKWDNIWHSAAGHWL